MLDALIAASEALAAGDNTSGPVIVVVPLRVELVAVSGPEILVVARLVVPVALRLPVLVVPKLAILEKRFWKLPVTAVKRFENRLVVVALVTIRLVIVALVAVKLSVLVVLALSIFVLILFAIIFAAVVVPNKFKLVSPLMVVVEVTPFTTLVIKLVVDEKLKLFVVVTAISDASEVVEMTPLTLVVMTPVEVEKVTALLDIIDDVADTPLITLVSVLPVTD